VSLHRIRTLVAKDFLELRRSLGVFVPPVIMTVVSVAIPFVLAVAVPALTGETLADDDDFRKVAAYAARYVPALAELPGQAMIQALLFQQFLLFFVLIPVTAAMAIATFSIIGEKQARTLEPLLATPITTSELLLAKVLAASLPALAFEVVALTVYGAGIWLLAAPGVFSAVATVRTLLLVLLVGPLTTLVAMQLAVIASSRANDPRSAQQIGVLVILPIIGLMVAQFTGLFWLTTLLVIALAAGLFCVWVILLIVGVRVFDRETILTRWT
jgi:ABC-2 type transport system permease protein